jgi:hypothetical protein
VDGLRFDSRRLQHASPYGLRMAGHFENWNNEYQLKTCVSYKGEACPAKFVRTKRGLNLPIKFCINIVCIASICSAAYRIPIKLISDLQEISKPA